MPNVRANASFVATDVSFDMATVWFKGIMLGGIIKCRRLIDKSLLMILYLKNYKMLMLYITSDADTIW